jgi:TDG/mug DNA glycosylase family protein
MIRYVYRNAKILFIGINPHPGSASRGVPFSNNKLFWYLLSDAGMIRETRNELRNDDTLRYVYRKKFNPLYRLGLVNIIDRPTSDVTQLKKDEELPGRKRILRILRTENPKVICFIGKITYEKYIGSKRVDFGWQADIGSSKSFVMHFPLRGEASVRVRELRIILRAAER